MLLIILSIFILSFAVSLIFWIAHIIMVKSQEGAKRWGNFIQYMKLFNTVEWEYDENYSLSLFGKSGGYIIPNYLHAGIVRFHGQNMYLDPISYYITIFYLLVKIQQIKRKTDKPKEKSIKWSSLINIIK